MTPQEAKDYFVMRLSDTVRYANGKQTRQREAFEVAVEVLEKQIPKKVIPLETGTLNDYSVCPSCNCALHKREDVVNVWFCPQCSQRLDWSDNK